ncbi:MULTISPECIES: outer membrane beta-barrel protein [unclassified Thioalkalivibrio]|uniref:outer membrane beta-barrel protein n=1 Tax=unclassified Thioalkalivibrio TaxID=2621013 RepID=UPI000380B337|nr:MULTISPECIES: outer membrane beta-barrel protein [unclassified Thioalkalivibrio]
MQHKKTMSMLALGALVLVPFAQASAVERGMEPSVALLGGVVSPDLSDASSDAAYGVEIGANCQLFQPATGVLRHHFSVSRYSDDPLKMTSAEINSHWMFEPNERLSLGFGPGIGYVRAELDDETNGLWAAQVGGSLKYQLDRQWFLGLEARYQFTENDRFDGRRADADNMRVMGKVGMQF